MKVERCAAATALTELPRPSAKRGRSRDRNDPHNRTKSAAISRSRPPTTTVTHDTPTLTTNPRAPIRNPRSTPCTPQPETQNDPGQPAEFLPPETDPWITELTSMSAEQRRRAYDAMHSERQTEIEEFFTLPHISGMEFGEDLTDIQQRRMRALIFSFRHTCAVPGVVKTLRGATFSLKTTEGGPVQSP